MAASQTNQPKYMIANFLQGIFFPLEGELETMNMAALASDLKRSGADLSYPSLRQLMKGERATVKGFELLKVEHFQPQQFKPTSLPLLHKDSNRTPVPVERGSAAAQTLEQLTKGMTIKELVLRFGKDHSPEAIISELTVYVDLFGYEVFYSAEHQTVQLVLPTGFEHIAYK